MEDLAEIYEILEVSFGRCENEGWDVPGAAMREDGLVQIAWNGRKYLLREK